MKYVCQVCGSDDPDHPAGAHPFLVVSRPGEPLALTIEAQGFYDQSDNKARLLARVRMEMRKYFPGRNFEIQPSLWMVNKRSENSLLAGEAHVATYIAFEV